MNNPTWGIIAKAQGTSKWTENSTVHPAAQSKGPGQYMAEISPFPGIYYPQTKTEPLEKVIAPPYDVISSRLQEALYSESSHNVVRIILNREEQQDDEITNCYTRSAGYLNSWLADGTLVEDESSAVYLYRQEFLNPGDGQRYVRSGLFCALKLEPYSAGVVLPHEETRRKAREDRMRLMHATKANSEPIYGLYEDPDGQVVRSLYSGAGGTEPLLAAEVDGDRHIVWRVNDSDIIQSIQSFLSGKRVWIADGHHRYETALEYRDERRAQDGNPDEAQVYDYILIVLSAFCDPGLIVLPTHRLIKNIRVDLLESFNDNIRKEFDVRRVEKNELTEAMKAIAGDGRHAFGVVAKNEVSLIALRDVGVMEKLVINHSPEWKQLDVSILQKLVLEDTLGIPALELATTPDIAYTRELTEAFELVENGEFEMALILNNPSADEVRQVAAAGDKMPPKSTFFYPKLWSGLIMRRV